MFKELRKLDRDSFKKIEKLSTQMPYDIVESQGNEIGVYDIISMERVLSKINEIIEYLNSGRK